MNTPTGYCPKAQGREERATLGQCLKHPPPPTVPALQAGEDSINKRLPGAARCALHPRL